MKNKTLWIVGAVVVVVIIAVVAFVLPHSGAPGAPAASNNSATAGGGTGTPMSLNGLLAAGVSQQCAFSSQNPQSETVAGTVYVTAGHLRGDFNSKNASGTLTASHIITDGTTAYVWTDNPAQGFKMAFADMSSSNTAMHGGVSADQDMNYSCTSWANDQTKFTLPANITFEDMSAMMNAGASAGAAAGAGTTAPAGTGSGAAGNAQMCAMCAQAGSAAAQAQCRAALHC